MSDDGEMPHWNDNGYGLKERIQGYPKSKRRHTPNNIQRQTREPMRGRHLQENTAWVDDEEPFYRWHQDFSLTERQKMLNDRSVAYSVNAYDASDIFAADSIRFMNQLGVEDIYSSRIKYTTFGSFMNVMNMVRTSLETFADVAEGVRFEFHGQNTVYLYLFDRRSLRQRVMVRIDDYLDCHEPYTDAKRDITIIGLGHPETVKALHDLVKPQIVEVDDIEIEWKFTAGGRTISKRIKLEEPVKPYTEFYPWLPCSLDEYIDNYLNSKSNILVLLGDPGTGKTSLLRYMVYSKRMNSLLTYDENLLASDSMFVEYLTNDHQNMLLIEDADVLLTDRENAGNKIMSKLLNVSDGMIKVFNKKMAFTANVGDIDDIDSAIIRPGRAFDVMMFRKLTYREACAAAEVAGIEQPKDSDRDYSLADLFNAKEVESVSRNVEQARKIKIGFSV